MIMQILIDLSQILVWPIRPYTWEGGGGGGSLKIIYGCVPFNDNLLQKIWHQEFLNFWPITTPFGAIFSKILHLNSAIYLHFQ